MSKLVTDIGKHNPKRSKLSLAVSSVLFGLSPLWVAAETVGQNDSDVKISEQNEAVEVIEVRGIRAVSIAHKTLSASLIRSKT